MGKIIILIIITIIIIINNNTNNNINNNSNSNINNENDNDNDNDNVNDNITRYSNFNVLCPRYNRETEGGRTFLVTGTKIWNELPLRIRMADSMRCFKHNMWTNIFSQQQFLSHFCV